jgi:hypothetical protein
LLPGATCCETPFTPCSSLSIVAVSQLPRR